VKRKNSLGVEFLFSGYADHQLKKNAALNLNIADKEMEEQFDEYIPCTSEAFLAKPSPANSYGLWLGRISLQKCWNTARMVSFWDFAVLILDL
jgi:hypothetical protein